MVQMCGTTGEPFHRMLKQFGLLTPPTPARQDAPFHGQDRGERRPEAHPLGRTVRRIRSTTSVRAAEW